MSGAITSGFPLKAKRFAATTEVVAADSSSNQNLRQSAAISSSRQPLHPTMEEVEQGTATVIEEDQESCDQIRLGSTTFLFNSVGTNPNQKVRL